MSLKKKFWILETIADKTFTGVIGKPLIVILESLNNPIFNRNFRRPLDYNSSIKQRKQLFIRID